MPAIFEVAWKEHVVWHVLFGNRTITLTKISQAENKWLLISASFTVKFEMIFSLTQQNTFSERFHFNINRKSIGSSKKRCWAFLKYPST